MIKLCDEMINLTEKPCNHLVSFKIHLVMFKIDKRLRNLVIDKIQDGSTQRQFSRDQNMPSIVKTIWASSLKLVPYSIEEEVENLRNIQKGIEYRITKITIRLNLKWFVNVLFV